MRTISLHQIDSFTDTLFGGNPAGVVANADDLSEKEMQLIAREMNLSETAFVMPTKVSDASLRIRYFTPTSEIDFCGHATIAALYALAQQHLHGLDKKGVNEVIVETGAGNIQMSVENKAGDKSHISFVAPSVSLEPFRLQDNAFLSTCNLPIDCLVQNSTILRDTKLNYIYVPITSLEKLGSLTFDQVAMRQSLEKDGIIAFCFFTPETKDPRGDLHVRVTCPLIGIVEDPFTGSTISGTIHAAKQLHLLDATKESIIIEQGIFMGRGGSANITHDLSSDIVTIHATATKVFSTELELA